MAATTDPKMQDMLDTTVWTKAAASLARRIELLDGVVGVGTSDRARNIFNEPHVQIINGAVAKEGEAAAGWLRRSVDEMLEAQFAAAQALREAVAGPVWLTWRVYPSYEVAGHQHRQIYMRLSFTSVAQVVAHFAAPAPEPSAAEPISLGERRSAKTHSGADWSPRDLMAKMLRDHDDGTTVIKHMVVSYMDTEGGGGFWASAPDRLAAIGLFGSGLVGYSMTPLELSR